MVILLLMLAIVFHLVGKSMKIAQTLYDLMDGISERLPFDGIEN